MRPKARPAYQSTFIWLASTALCLLLSACAPLPDDEASWVLKDLAAGSEPSYLKTITCSPRREAVFYQSNQQTIQADLYLPKQPPLAALVLSPGLAEAGKDDPRLQAFATSLARARFLILVPDLPNLRALKVRKEDVQHLVNSVHYLMTRDDTDDVLPLGMGAFSYTVGPTVLAALNPSIHEQLDFVLSIGGYYDLNQVIRFFTSGYFQHQDEWLYLQPNQYGKWVFVLSNADLLSAESDRDALSQMAQRKLQSPAAALDDMKPGLTEDGYAVLALIQNNDRSLSPALIAALPREIRNELEALNLANKSLSQLSARLLLIHGTDDSIIPFSESVALHNAAGGKQSELFLIDGLAHVDIRPLELDRHAAWQAITAILLQRKAGSVETEPCKDRSFE